MKKILIFIVLILVAGGVYFKYGNKSNEPKKYSGPMEDVTLALKWIHQAQFAGHYVAKEKGFYANEGLNVNITPFEFKDSSIDSVDKGNATFGVTGADQLVLARSKGIPVVAIGVIYKTNPVAAYSLKSSGITKPQDFVGKTVGLEKGTDFGYLYGAMMTRLGIDRKKIKEVEIGYDATELLAGKTDVSTGYIINEPQLAIEAGKEINTILLADYGVNIYADVLFAAERTIENKPELVTRFLRATLNGWQYSIEHESEAVDATMKYATTSNAIHQAHMLSASIPLINSGFTQLGVMEGSVWESVKDTLVSQKLLDKSIDVTHAYSLKFLKEIYP